MTLKQESVTFGPDSLFAGLITGILQCAICKERFAMRHNIQVPIEVDITAEYVCEFCVSEVETSRDN
jgi:hypothetical protein